MVLLQTNVQVMKEIMTQITAYTRSAIIINVSNPMDILTYIAQTEFNYPRNLLIGTGTLLDTARFNKMLADLCGVDAKNVTGFVLGNTVGPVLFHGMQLILLEFLFMIFRSSLA